MALGRMEAKIVSRGSGHSAVAKAAYNAREALTAERYDKREDYSRKADDCLFRGFYTPAGAPEWAQERGRFWNAVEWREKRKDAQLGREFEIALPAELTAEQNRWLLQDFVRENFTRRGYVADVAIHAPSKDGDARNIHAHVFVPLRRLEGDHWAEKKDRPSKLERANELKELRASWERLANRHLGRHGFTERIDMRSYAEQGIDRTPGIHMGKEATAKERRGEETELGNRNRAAANENRPHGENFAGIEEARERAAYARQQRDGFRRQDEDRANATWDAADGSTLSNARQRDREAGNSRSTENEARRAMDDLARTDPLGTARHFGHHAGDRLKSPEEMRREMAERMRGFAADAQPDLGRGSPQPAPKPGRATGRTMREPEGPEIAARRPERRARPAAPRKAPEATGDRPMGFFGRLMEKALNFGSPLLKRSSSPEDDPSFYPGFRPDRSSPRAPEPVGMTGGRESRAPDSRRENDALADEMRAIAEEAARRQPKPDEARAARLLEQIDRERSAAEPDAQTLKDLSRQYHELRGATPPSTPTRDGPTVLAGDDTRRQQEAGTEQGREHERRQRRETARQVGDQQREQTRARSPLEALRESLKAEKAQTPKAAQPTQERTAKRGGGRTMGGDDKHDGGKRNYRTLRATLQPFDPSKRVRDRQRKP